MDLSAGTVAVDSSANNQNITFTSTIDDDSAGDTDLTLTAGTGAVDLQGAVGATNRLDDFTVSTATSDLMNMTADTIAVTSTNIDLKGTTYTSSVGGITLTGAVDLDLSAGTVTVDSSANNQNITFTSTIDDDSAGDTDLTLTAGTGAVDLQGAVGATNRLDDFTVASTATSDLMNVTADICGYEYEHRPEGNDLYFKCWWHYAYRSGGLGLVRGHGCRGQFREQPEHHLHEHDRRRLCG